MSKERDRPWVTVDVVVVAPDREAPDAGEGEEYRVLLIRRRNPPFQGRWAIPGGFVEPGETLEAAARRELWEETGLEPRRLEQLRAFGAPGRDPRGWVISIAHLALVGAGEAAAWQPRAASDADDVGWFDLDDPPPLAFDHQEILASARQALQEKAGHRDSPRRHGGAQRKARTDL
ncbi:MAG: NUDIX hydrolase [Anaerolineae bacterium]